MLLRRAQVLRIIRLLRLIKLLRVLRSARIFARLEHSLGWSYVTLSLIRYFTMAWLYPGTTQTVSFCGALLLWTHSTCLFTR